MAIGLSPAGQQLFSSVSPGPGLGDLLRGQVQETDDLRKKRLAQMQVAGSRAAAGTRAGAAGAILWVRLLILAWRQKRTVQ